MAAMITAYQAIFYDHRCRDWRPLASVTVGSLVLLAVCRRVFEPRREEFAELV